jgi:hypothetical protein
MQTVGFDAVATVDLQYTVPLPPPPPQQQQVATTKSKTKSSKSKVTNVNDDDDDDDGVNAVDADDDTDQQQQQQASVKAMASKRKAGVLQPCKHKVSVCVDGMLTLQRAQCRDKRLCTHACCKIVDPIKAARIDALPDVAVVADAPASYRAAMLALSNTPANVNAYAPIADDVQLVRQKAATLVTPLQRSECICAVLTCRSPPLLVVNDSKNGIFPLALPSQASFSSRGSTVVRSFHPGAATSLSTTPPRQQQRPQQEQTQPPPPPMQSASNDDNVFAGLFF